MATPEAITRALDKMAEQRDALLAEAEALSDEAAAYAPPDGEGEAAGRRSSSSPTWPRWRPPTAPGSQRALDEDDPDVTKDTPSDPPAIRLDDAALALRRRSDRAAPRTARDHAAR